MRVIISTLATLALLGGTAVAQEDGRYWIEKSGDGYVRMDRTTGEMSYCSERTGQIVCRLAADDRLALQDEIGRLEERLAAMEERLAALEQRSAEAGDAPPSEEEFEKTMGYMERFFRRFMGIVKEFERDFGGGSKEPPADRT